MRPSSPLPLLCGGRGGDFINARFLGTDYNFCFNPQFRALFLPHSPSSLSSPSSPNPSGPPSPLTSIAISPSSSPSPPSDDFLPLLHRLLAQPQKPRHRPIPWQGPGADELHALVQSTLHVDVPSLIFLPVAFPRAVVYGIVMALYGLVCFAVFEQAMQELINGVTTSSVDLSGEWFWLLPPLASALFDALTSVLYGVREWNVIYLLKAVLYTVYYATPFVILQGEGEGVNAGRRVMEMILPLLFITYSVCFFMWMRMTRRLE